MKTLGFMCLVVGLAFSLFSDDAGVMDVHGSTPEGYVPVAEPAVRDFPVVGTDGTAVQRAIDAAAAAGGGRVVVGPGDYPSGSLRLRNRVELHLQKGAMLVGGAKSEDYFDFPVEVCSVCPEDSSKVFLYGWDLEDVAITGEGIIEGRGPEFFDRTKLVWGNRFWAKPAHPRPRMVQLVRCRRVRLEGVTFKDSPGWTMLVRLCEDVRAENIKVIADQRIINSDGIDFDGCRRVRVRHSTFKTGDDCLIVRSMRERPDDRIVSEDIVFEDCDLDSACQTIRMGCPSDDVIRNVRIRNMRARGYNGINFDYPAHYLRSDDEGYMHLSDVEIENFNGDFGGCALRIFVGPGLKLRNLSDIRIRNCRLSSAQPLRFVGNADSPLKDIILEDVTVTTPDGVAPWEAAATEPLVFKNSIFNGKRESDRCIVTPRGERQPLVRPAGSWETKKRESSCEQPAGAACSDVAPAAERGTWFREARFGMFIHWGIYSIPGKGEWSYANDKYAPGEYEAYAKRFNPVNYRPREWAKRAKAAGMKYAVLTSRHHDGFCMFDSRFTDYKITNTPYGKDAVREFLEAFRAEGLKVGLYHSLPDWTHPGYADTESPECIAGGKKEPHVPTAEQYAAFTNLVYNHINQLTTEYDKLDLLFLDYTSRTKAELDYFGRDHILEMVYRNQPNILVNDRLSYFKDNCRDFDYYTPEICVPNQPQVVKGREVMWETCATMNDHWGYCRDDENWKSPEAVIAGLVGCVSHNGNLLLNVGPTEQGEIPAGSVRILDALARWNATNGEAVSGCGASACTPPFGCAYTQRGRTLYLHFLQPPLGDTILPGLKGRIGRMTSLRTGGKVDCVDNWGFELLKPDEQRIRSCGIVAGDVIRIELK